MIYFDDSHEKIISNAIIINAPDEYSGVRAEYDYLEAFYPGFQLLKQELIMNNGRPCDLLNIIIGDREETCICFDISDFYGKGWMEE